MPTFSFPFWIFVFTAFTANDYHEKERMKRGWLALLMLIWFDLIWYGMIWYDTIWYDMIWYDMIWYDMVWYGMVWYGMVWYDMTWYDMIWYDMIWYNMIWYDMILIFLWLYQSIVLWGKGIPLLLVQTGYHTIINTDLCYFKMISTFLFWLYENVKSSKNQDNFVLS